MSKMDAILAAVALAIVLTISCCSLAAWAQSAHLTADVWTAIGGIALVIATGFLVVVGELQRRSAEKVAKMQIVAAEKLSDRQTYSLKWMEEQKTKPYCDFIIILKTATTKPIGVYLKNFGHGPALKMKWRFTWKDQAISGIDREGLRQVASKYSLHHWLEAYVPSRLAASSEEPIFRLRDADPRNTEQVLDARDKAAHELTRMIEEMNIELEFVSIMGQQETIKLHDNDEKLIS